jgi:hypothetical protein
MIGWVIENGLNPGNPTVFQDGYGAAKDMAKN